MNYYALKSIINSGKNTFSVSNPTSSFNIVTKRPEPFVEPSLSKIEFNIEKPPIIIVSAIGASGKTTLARALSSDLELPLLDLGKHQPVGDHSFLGTLSDAFGPEEIAGVLPKLSRGEYCVIIDGIDEGRSKTTEKGFEAFIDDVFARVKCATKPAVVLLSRGDAMLDTWAYLADKGANVGLIQIDPFHAEKARLYIDEIATPKQPDRVQQYELVRDEILEVLSSAFGNKGSSGDLSHRFMGYPPVLDAIATLLTRETNYHKLSGRFREQTRTDQLIGVLIEITEHLMEREKTEKAYPQFIENVAKEHGLPRATVDGLYSKVEQSAWLLSTVMGREVPQAIIPTNPEAEQHYREVAFGWVKEHPFLDNGRFRNVVFESAALANLLQDSTDAHRDLAGEYVRSHGCTYHLAEMLAAKDQTQNTVQTNQCLNAIVQSATDLVSIDTYVSIELFQGYRDEPENQNSCLDVSVEIADDKDIKRQLSFRIDPGSSFILGPRLVNLALDTSNEVRIVGEKRITIHGVCRLSAGTVVVQTPEVVLRPDKKNTQDGEAAFLSIETESLSGNVENMNIQKNKISIRASKSDAGYPLSSYVNGIPDDLSDNNLSNKYRRLRRILILFRSHSKGKLARYKDKIRHRRVLKDRQGAAILQQLLDSGVLYGEGEFFFIDNMKLSQVLGITWNELNDYVRTEKTETFLKSI